MIVIESTFWPLIVVGAVPDAPGAAGDGANASQVVASIDEGRLWSSGDLRLAVVIAGDQSRARPAQEEVFAWLVRHRDRLLECASRVAWIFEDEATRQSSERWLALAGDRLFSGPVTTFRSVRSAVSWLASDLDDDDSAHPQDVSSVLPGPA